MRLPQKEMCDSRFDTDHVPQTDSTTTKKHYISKTMLTRLTLVLFKITVLYYEKEMKPSDAHDFMAAKQASAALCYMHSDTRATHFRRSIVPPCTCWNSTLKT